jgi:hypothetical protein
MSYLRRIQPSIDDTNEKEEEEETPASESESVGLIKVLPGWTFMPLFGIATTLVLMAIMLPM